MPKKSINFSYFTWIVILSVILNSCCYEVDCRPSRLTPNFISFTPTDLNPIIIRKFKTGSNYINPIDSLYIGNINGYFPYYRGDTLILQSVNDYIFSPNNEFQFEIDILNVRMVTRISDIVEESASQEKCFANVEQQPCFNKIISFRQNNQTVYSDQIFIKR